jgi:TrmH family RNA methyltransferase
MIDSPANPTVKALRSLDRPKHARERGHFLVEGVRAVEDGLRAGFFPDICLYNGDLLRRTERGARLLDALIEGARQHPSSTVLEATPRAIEAAADTLHPQGVVAAFPLVEWDRDRVSARHESAPLALVCDDIQDPGNLGTILRTAEAAGVAAAYLSPRCVDAYNPKVVRAAMGAHFRLPLYALPWPGIEQALRELGVPRERVFATDAEAATPYDQVDWTLYSALVVSNEAHGLTPEASALAGGGKQVIAIPMLGGTESLNAATAAAVVLFEAARQRRAAAS